MRTVTHTDLTRDKLIGGYSYVVKFSDGSRCYGWSAGSKADAREEAAAHAREAMR